MRHQARRGTCAAAGLAVVLAFWLGAAAQTVQASLGPHSIGANPCGVCHDTAKGTPTLRGWIGASLPDITGTAWAGRTLSSLCYMCHESLELNGAHDMSANAYAANSHLFTVAAVKPDPDGSPQSIATTLPYMTKTAMECTSCHNVHRYESRPFNQRPTVSALCNECHAGRMNTAPLRGAANTQTLGGRGYSTHPTGLAVADTARANLKNLADVQSTNVAKTIAAAPGYAIGGHLLSATGDSGNFDCGTCHAVHGVSQGSGAARDLLAIDNTTGASGSALCNACHHGGANSAEAVGVLNSSDHPIDDVIGRAMYPTGVAIPTTWTTAGGQVDRGAQPFFTTGVTGTPACSSCHDTHGGIGGTALLRGPQPPAVWDPMDYDNWCFACHAVSLILPTAHHSVIKNLAIALGDAINSQLSCGDCHGPAGFTDWRAHNGFWAWPVPVNDHTSGLCLDCHTSTNPRFLKTSSKGKSFTNGATVFPATHGTLRGSASHYLGPDSGEFAGAAPKLTRWTGGINPGYYSTYGPTGSTGGGFSVPTGTEIICESCHNTLWNDGRANPGSYPPYVPLGLKAGWQSNLLLERYEDDPPGGGAGAGANGIVSTLCTGCHSPAGNHHPLTGEVVPLSGLALRTGAGSFANQTSAPSGAGAAPGTLSYPNVNAVDCDSCHRPHSADSDSDVSAASHGNGSSTDGRPTNHILEVDGTGHRYTDLCDECHLF